MNKICNWFWTALDHKGRFATIIGFAFSLPFNIKFTLDWYRGIEYSRENLETIIIVNVISIIWFILPSIITIEGPKFKFRIED